MFYIVETNKSVEQASADLEESIKKHNFGVLHIHDLKATLNKKGVPFEPGCRVFEVCNPHEAAQVLAEDMSLNMALPCRVSVYEQDGKTKIGMIRPMPLLSALSDSEQLRAVAERVEKVLTEAIQEAC
ncbi:MAG: DUF302 domain-containing protein [Myxococcales bacterium]|nr:DUF302 domain-containing protein [Myxococcales bacterium]